MVNERGGAASIRRSSVPVPFNKPYLVGREFELMAEAVRNDHLSGNGPFSKRCATHLQNELGAELVLLTHSCTGALEMAAILAGIGPGDEVVMPSFTFPSVANAFVLRGATPVFVDIREDTLNLDERLLADALTPRTRAIVPVHYAGVGCELDQISRITTERGLALIEDAAHAYGARWQGRPLGSFGNAAGLSFHETKNVISGEGGALIVNDPSWVERAEILHEKGTNRRAFSRGEVDKYTWVDVGSSFLAGDLTAARRAIWNRYHAGFANLEAHGMVRRPVIPDGAEHNGHLYYLLLPSRETRDRLIDKLAESEIQAVFHYVPLHSSPAGLRFGRVSGELGVTEDASARLIRLPMWIGMGDDEVDQVVEAVSQAGVIAA
jgi:dTDP-4-amino-4,6-dideoxygalactose transaminase